MFRRCKPLLGTYVEITIYDSMSDEAAFKITETAFEEVALVHRLMSFQNQDSELSLLNSEAFSRNIKVHPYTYKVLEVASIIHSITLGSFDCSIGHHLQRDGILPGHTPIAPRANMNAVLLQHPNTVRYQQRLCIDLSGIAKGFAVDCAINRLSLAGIESAVVNAGGDLRILGEYSEEIWVRNPKNQQSLIYLGSLSNGAIATSSIYYSKDINHKTKTGSLINPITGCAINDEDSYSVIAPSCVMADGLTKALAIDKNTKANYLLSQKAIGIIL